MDEDRIGLVLAKTLELRSKIISCIHKTASNVERVSDSKESAENKENDDIEEETESLLNIKDALDSLEARLSSLQALQQQQWYEKEEALAEIEYRQKKLLKELKEYKGKDLEVIHEAMAFASETDENNDLLLPPYPSRPSQTILLKNGFVSSFTSRRSLQNGSTGIHKRDQRQSEPGGPFKSVGVLIGTVAKTAITVVSVITILSLAGFKPRPRKQDNLLKVLDLFHPGRSDEKGSSVECPSGKVAVVENGETRCVVKERVEVPFESFVAIPDVSYGCG